MVRHYYGERVAQRSQVPLLAHILEGLAVLAAIGASEQAMRAFCLHPLLQADADLAENFLTVSEALSSVVDGAVVLALALEYRSVANEFLSDKLMPAAGIRLSPLKDVNNMLIADKVQNKKDFLIHHATTHARREALATYFDHWLRALGVSDRYGQLAAHCGLVVGPGT